MSRKLFIKATLILWGFTAGIVIVLFAVISQRASDGWGFFAGILLTLILLCFGTGISLIFDLCYIISGKWPCKKLLLMIIFIFVAFVGAICISLPLFNVDIFSFKTVMLGFVIYVAATLAIMKMPNKPVLIANNDQKQSPE